MKNYRKEMLVEVAVAAGVPIVMLIAPMLIVSCFFSSPEKCQKGLTDGATEAAAKITGDYI